MSRLTNLAIVAFIFSAAAPSVYAVSHTSGYTSANLTAHIILSLPGEDCGGPSEIECGANEFCVLPYGSCSGTSAIGFCVSNDARCLGVVTPVCGCDGNTYNNECEAWVFNNVNVDHDGICMPISIGIPATSTWGVILMSLIMMTFGTVVLRSKARIPINR